MVGQSIVVKRISSRFSNPQRRAAQHRWKRSLLTKQKSAQKRGALWTYPSLAGLEGKIRFVRLLAPKIWSISQQDQRAEIVRFLREFRQTLLIGDGGAIVDFSQVRTIYPHGGLLVVAEFDRVRRLIDDSRRLKCKPAIRGTVPDQVLTQIGLYDCLNHRSVTDAEDESVVHWRRASGMRVEGVEAAPLLDNFDGEISDALKTSLYRGITEAMTNAVQHAYLKMRNDGTKATGEKRWWMFSQQREGILNVVFCDLGIGIPRSLPIVHNGFGALLAKVGPGRFDVEAIRLATEVGKTSTAHPGRGNGLREILDAARKAGQGACVIYSNRGRYGFASDGQVVENQFSNSIFGTLIDWRVPVTEGVSDDSQSN